MAGKKNKTMDSAKRILLSCTLFLGILMVSCTNAFAKQDAPLVQRLAGSQGQVAKDSFAVTSDILFDADPSHPTYDLQSCRYQNIVTLKINEGGSQYIQGDFTVSVHLLLTLTDASGNQTTQPQILSVAYSKTGGTTYQAMDYRILSGYRTVKVAVSDTISRNVGWDVSQALTIENEMRITRDYNFRCSVPVTGLAAAYPKIGGVDQADELLVTWNDPNNGQTEYDLEWAWIDDVALAGYRNTSGQYDPSSVFGNNASRVTLDANHLSYKLPLMYDGIGTLFYRVRPVQTKLAGLRVEGTWTLPTAAAQFAFGGHQANLNWQVTTSYAEEGKRKTVVQYFDGSLRGRQTVTKDNSVDVPTTVVAETMYDYQGRPAVQVLPAPTLNTIIQFSKNFNQSIGQNGAVEYTKAQYDGLLPSDLLCIKPAGAMHTASGASRYYSPNNPKQDAFNRYIPDAQNYPFTETRYAPDATGRIATQGGVGANHVLGSGHETRYYYGQADQEDLDPLFGTDVGSASHYFKNMVRDANGQYSVSYVDMHGRTVATALAGGAPAGIQQLPNFAVRQNITKKLLDGETNIVKNRSIESAKEVLVPVGGLYRFRYNLSPASLQLLDRDGSPICYSCLYDLTINISNDCGNCGLPNKQPIVISRTDFSLDKLDSVCANAPGSLLVDTTILFAEGSYTVRKTLTLSRGAQDGYRNGLYTRRNTIKTFASIYSEALTLMQGQQTNCNITCESCNASIGSFPDYESRFLVAMGLGAQDEGEELQAEIKTAYAQAVAGCAAICNKGTTRLNGIRSAMLMDMTPSIGQYANPDNAAMPYNIFNNGSTPGAMDFATGLPATYNDVYGKPAMPDPAFLSQQDFAGAFQNPWAEKLLYYHPEYPRLHLAENELKTSYGFDNRVQGIGTYADASALMPGMDIVAADPFFTARPALAGNMNTLVSDTYKSGTDQASGATYSYSMWQVAYAAVHCNDRASSGSCINDAPKSPSGFNALSCTNDWDMVWATFRQIYLSEKEKMVYDWATGQINANGQAPASNADLAANNYTPRFIDPSNMGGAVGAAAGTDVSDPAARAAVQGSANDSINQFYSDNCHAAAATWLQQLQPLKVCNPSVTDADLDNLVAQLVQVCIKGSDATHPFGSSSVSPANAAYQPTSFPGAITAFMAARNMPYNTTCNPYMLDGPQAYEAPATVYASVDVVARPDSCTCERLAQLAAEAVAKNYTGSLSAFLKANYNTDIAQGALDTLLGRCNGTLAPDCLAMANAIALPPLLQCSAVQPYQSCLSCTLLRSYISSFTTTMGTVPMATPANAADTATNVLFARFMNRYTGFGYTWDRYMAFLQQCSGYSEPVVDVPPCDLSPYNTVCTGSQVEIYSSLGTQVFAPGFSPDGTGTTVANLSGPVWVASGCATCGPLNRASVWTCGNDGLPNARPPYDQWVAVSHRVYFPQGKTYYFGLSGDNLLRLSIDGNVVVQGDGRFTNWRIFPIQLTAGTHTVSVAANNVTSPDGNAYNYAAIGCEIYDCTYADLLSFSSFTSPLQLERFTIYTTASEVGRLITPCPAPPAYYTGPTLCGSGKPVYQTLTVARDNTCNDVYRLATNRATELFAYYTDSLANLFDTAYYNRCMQAAQLETFTVTSQVSEYHYTLYYYDQAGSLVKTVPPAGVQANYDATWLQGVADARANNQTVQPVHTLPTNYRYNTLGQLVQQQTPDAGLSSYWYDRLGRLVLSQNAKQAAGNGSLYSYTLYDALGRITEVGQLPNTTPMQQATSQDPALLANWLNVSTTNQSPGIQGGTQITRTVYDLPFGPFLGTSSVLWQSNLRNRVSYVQLWDNGNDALPKSSTYYTYDIHGNVDTLLQDINQGAMQAHNRYKKIAYDYDLISGKVNLVQYQPPYYGANNNLLYQPDYIAHRYGYDAENRLVAAYATTDDVHWETIGSYQYYRHGPLARTVLGQQQVQGVDYAYTLQGWLKGINPGATAHDATPGCIAGNAGQPDRVVFNRVTDPPTTTALPQYIAAQSITFAPGFASNDGDLFETLLATVTATDCNAGLYDTDGSSTSMPARDVFGLGIDYYGSNDYHAIAGTAPQFADPTPLGNSYHPLYNGNISALAINLPKVGVPVLYSYQYDQLNRIVAQDAYTGLGTTNNNGTWQPVHTDDYKERLGYDPNGKITAYQRWGQGRQLDQATYNYYPSTNRLEHIGDPLGAHTDRGGRDVKDQAANNYQWNEIGEMKVDNDRGLAGATWTVYGKIQQQALADGRTINYTYGPNGNRLSKTLSGSAGYSEYYVQDASGNTMALYRLENGVLKFSEANLYGSSRLGSWQLGLDVTNPAGTASADHEGKFIRGQMRFDLSDHRGNVYASITDGKIGFDDNGDGTIDRYEADIISAQDYSSFGAILEGRTFGNTPRYTYNGKQLDQELGWQAYGERELLSDGGPPIFTSPDDLTGKFPMLTPYQFASNRPIDGIDLDGLEYDKAEVIFEPAPLIRVANERELIEIPENVRIKVGRGGMTFSTGSSPLFRPGTGTSTGINYYNGPFVSGSQGALVDNGYGIERYIPSAREVDAMNRASEEDALERTKSLASAPVHEATKKLHQAAFAEHITPLVQITFKSSSQSPSTSTQNTNNEKPKNPSSSEPNDGNSSKIYLVRRGADAEDADKLGGDAARAEKVPKFGHGVSTTMKTRVSGTDKKNSRSALLTDVAKIFKVKSTPTANDPKHVTVILPKPVTKEVAAKFNSLFKVQN